MGWNKRRTGYTVMVVAEDGGKSFRFMVRPILLFLSALTIVVLGLGVGVFISEMLTMRRIVDDYQRLEVQNRSIRSEAEALQFKIQEIEDSLLDLETVASKLRGVNLHEGAFSALEEKKNFDEDGESTEIDLEDVKDLGPLSAEDYELAKQYGYRAEDLMVHLKSSALEFGSSFERIDYLHKTISSRLNEYQRLLVEALDYQIKSSKIPTFFPTKGRITSRFGLRKSPFNGSLQMHWGTDIANAKGTPIYATAAGTVSFTGTKNAYGKMIDIEHGNGINTRYAHLHKYYVKNGDFVLKGHVIGEMGNTGRSTGPHLHYEISVNGKRVNPNLYMSVVPESLAQGQMPPLRQ